MPQHRQWQVDMSRDLKHFLDLDAFDKDALRQILDLGHALKSGNANDYGNAPLAGKTLAMIFEKPSTRTRVSFEVGMRTDDPAKLQELSVYASVPVINGLTDLTHPCQIMADIMTFEQHRGPIAGKTIAWTGDGNNVSNSFIQAAALFDFSLRLACPDSLRPNSDILKWAIDAGADITVTDDPTLAVENADCVVTDTWVSMHQDRGDRVDVLTPYRVTEALMGHAADDALFMHCLPAHRGEEVVDAVMDGQWSVVWDESENRLHAQKGILLWSLG
jgi:ornithine carbamoyltransferase